MAKKLLLFSTPYCGPCHKLKQELKEIKELIEVIEVDCTQNAVLASQFMISTVPSVVCVDGMIPVWSIVGGATKERILKELRGSVE